LEQARTQFMTFCLKHWNLNHLLKIVNCKLDYILKWSCLFKEVSLFCAYFVLYNTIYGKQKIKMLKLYCHFDFLNLNFKFI